MYRLFAVFGAALALAACSSTSELGGLDVFKSGPILDTVQLESEPPGAEAKASNGQTCRTPCALALPTDQAIGITFNLAGYDPETEQLEVVTGPGEPPRLRPNPVIAELTAATAKPVKKPARAKRAVAKKPAAKKPAAKKPAAANPAPKAAATKPAPTPAAATPAAAAPAAPPTFAPPPANAASPWPAPPPQR